MDFDNRSLAAAVTLATLLATVARFLLVRMHPAIPGLARWAWAILLGSVSLGIFSAFGRVPVGRAHSLSQVLVFVSFLLDWDGFRRFLGRKPLAPQGPALAVLALGLAMGWADAQGSWALPSIVAALALAGVLAMTARELLIDGSAGGVAMRCTGGVYLATTTFFVARAAAIAIDHRPDPPLPSDDVNSATLLWALAFAVATTLGMVLMAGERLQRELNDQASRDPLTGALNRRAFALLAQKAVARCHRLGDALSVLVMDLDQFKQINDRHGHAVGDACLCRFVAIAESTLRAEDVVCRFGGEEFVALMSGASLSQALSAAERLRTAFAEEMRADPSMPAAATVSIGVGTLAEGETMEHLLHRADAALYRAKHSGRNRCDVALSPAPQAEAAEATA